MSEVLRYIPVISRASTGCLTWNNMDKCLSRANQYVCRVFVSMEHITHMEAMKAESSNKRSMMVSMKFNHEMCYEKVTTYDFNPLSMILLTIDRQFTATSSENCAYNKLSRYTS